MKICKRANEVHKRLILRVFKYLIRYILGGIVSASKRQYIKAVSTLYSLFFMTQDFWLEDEESVNLVPLHLGRG